MRFPKQAKRRNLGRKFRIWSLALILGIAVFCWAESEAENGSKNQSLKQKVQAEIVQFRKALKPEKTGDDFLDGVLEDVRAFSQRTLDEVVDILGETESVTPPPKGSHPKNSSPTKDTNNNK